MSPDKIIHMANQIADFFATHSDEQAAAEIAAHINDFWAPAMRKDLSGLVIAGHTDLSPLVEKALPHINMPSEAKVISL